MEEGEGEGDGEGGAEEKESRMDERARRLGKDEERKENARNGWGGEEGREEWRGTARREWRQTG
jgi:hypothetical protein